MKRHRNSGHSADIKSPFFKKVSNIIYRCLYFIPAAGVLFMTICICFQEPEVAPSPKGQIFMLTAFAVFLLLALPKIKIPDFIKWLIFAVYPVALCYLVELFTHDPSEINIRIFLLNAGIIYALSLLLLFATGRMSIVITSVTVLFLIFGLINYYLIMFRGAPLFPWDINSVNTGVTVLNHYNLTITYELARTVILFLFIFLLGMYCNLKIKLRHKYGRPVLSVVSLIILLSYSFYLQTDDVIERFGLYNYLFSPDAMYETNGLTISFLSNLKYMNVEKPGNYSTDELRDVMSEYDELKPSSDINNTGKLPNVIAIMNEAFSDLSVLGDFSTNTDYMPFMKSLSENTIKGNLFVSVKGGNTANTEFEFLTGSTMAFLPTGSIPYQQYIDKETPSLISQMNSLGYTTIAMHPFGASGWERDKVYRYFGFDEILFREDFTDVGLIRDFVSDRTVYDKIIDFYDRKDEDEKLFLFTVTMQNHGGYTKNYDNFVPDVSLTGYEDNEIISRYLSLIKESDSAFEYLIEYFEYADEDTIILFFGDHQPNDDVVEPILELNGVDIDNPSLEDQQKRYEVPFIIWANYDIAEESFDAVSINYLSTLLLETAGIGLTTQQTFLSELMKEYPVINANGTVDADGDYGMIDDMGSDRLINIYQMLQYNLIFDPENRIGEYFSAE